MTQKFNLSRVTDIAPGCGEDLGGALGKLAESVVDRSVRVQVLYLAAEAFEQGASVTMGHNRSDRYLERAEELRRKAAALFAEVKAERDDAESASLLSAFRDGYFGNEGSRHSFDRREAFLIGQLFDKEGRPTPSRINKVYSPRPLGRDSERDHLLVDGERYVVDYPEGKIADAIVSTI